MNRNSKKTTAIILSVIILVIMGARAVFTTVQTARSTQTTATLIESNGSNVDRRTTRKKVNGRKRKYLIVEVYQHMVLEYELEGNTVQRDAGNLLVERSETKVTGTASNNLTDGDYINKYCYDIGDRIEIYVTPEGKVYLADELEAEQKGSIGMMGGAVLLVVLLIASSLKKNREE
ncbi:MAG: hypothetical protein IJ368_00755 [Oscillospiraceae bacterium]|nr:hypothetical protein [Oscillospiraceae bacterium]